LIFVLLCLTTFAVLSLVSALADKSLTDRSAQAMTEYYAADGEAEEILGKIDAALHSSRQNGEDAFYSGAGPLLSGIDPSVRVDGRQVHYAVPLNDSQELRVSLEITFSPSSRLYELNEWKVVNTADWQPEDELLNLWTGSEDFVILG